MWVRALSLLDATLGNQHCDDVFVGQYAAVSLGVLKLGSGDGCEYWP